jgi:hypothetical protein
MTNLYAPKRDGCGPPVIGHGETMAIIGFPASGCRRRLPVHFGHHLTGDGQVDNTFSTQVIGELKSATTVG